jgi:hypothetical protein
MDEKMERANKDNKEIKDELKKMIIQKMIVVETDR